MNNFNEMKKSFFAFAIVATFVCCGTAFGSNTVVSTTTVYGKGGRIEYPDGTVKTCPDKDPQDCARITTTSGLDLSPGVKVTVDHMGGLTETLIIDTIGELESDGSLQGSNIIFRVQ